MEWLEQILFSDSPKRVRQRKMQMLFFAVVIGVLACVVVGAIIYFIGRPKYN